MSPTGIQSAEAATHRDVLAAICAGTANLFRERWGRGPRKCRAHWAGEDLLVVLLEGGLTEAEKTLRAGGHGVQVADARRAFQALAEPELRRIAEKATGREVTEVLAATPLDADLAAELFVLGGDLRPRLDVHAQADRAADARRTARDSIAQAHAVLAQSAQAQRVNAQRRRRD